MEKLFNCVPHFLTKQVVPRLLLPFRNVYLSYKILGERTFDPPKPPIFIVHAILGNKREWEAIGKTIFTITQRTVVTIDLRNHGHSPHENSHRLTDQAEDVLHLFEKLGANKASLIGHSMGGRTAMCAALMAPNKIAGLLVVDISPKTTLPEYGNILKVLKEMHAFNLSKFKKISKAKLAIRKHMKPFITDENVIESVIGNLKPIANGKIAWACNVEILIKDYKYWSSFPDNLETKVYDGPTLFIGGQLSDYIPADDLTAIRRLFPRAVIIYIPKTKHYPHVDDPKSFLELAISFIRTNSYKDLPAHITR